MSGGTLCHWRASTWGRSITWWVFSEWEDACGDTGTNRPSAYPLRCKCSEIKKDPLSVRTLVLSVPVGKLRLQRTWESNLITLSKTWTTFFLENEESWVDYVSDFFFLKEQKKCLRYWFRYECVYSVWVCVWMCECVCMRFEITAELWIIMMRLWEQCHLATHV